jgi:hypothetical protein
MIVAIKCTQTAAQEWLHGAANYRTLTNRHSSWETPTAQYTHTVSVIQTNHSMLYREIIAVCSQIHTKHINTLCGQNVGLWNVKLAVHIVTTRV